MVNSWGSVPEFAAPMEARTPGAKRAANGEHLFDLRSVNRVMGGPGNVFFYQ